MKDWDWDVWNIVIDPKAAAPVVFAARELQEYLRKITGRLIKIVEVTEARDPYLRQPLGRCIFVGESRLATKLHPAVNGLRLQDEEILIRRVGTTIILRGGGARGALYAVYVFLEKYLGCRFFTEDAEYVPDTMPVLPQAFEFRSAPDFAVRDMRSLLLRSGSWSAKNRFNGEFANVTAIQGFKRGIYPFVHTYEHLVPPERYFRTHPEYFSLIDGERNPKQLCLSNPRVLEIAVQTVLRWIKENPGYDVFDISENDGGGFCHCDNCWRMNGSEIRQCNGHPTQPGTYFRFVNLVAEAVAARAPGKWIETLSYGPANRFPPEHFDMAPNVLIRVCMNGKAPLDRLNMWLKATRNIGIWHYFTYLDFLLPFPLVLHAMPTVLRHYHALGIRNVMLQTPDDEHGGIETLKLQNYVASKLFWDVRANPAEHVREFIRFYYGPIAEHMQRVFDITQTQLQRHGAQFDCWYWFRNPRQTLLGAMPHLAKHTLPLLERAARSVRGTPYALRVDEALLPFRYYDWIRDIRQPRFTKNGAWPMDFAPVRKSVRKMFTTLRKLGVHYWHHDYTMDVLERALKPELLQRVKNKFLEVLILPGVGGRIVQIYDRRRNQALIPGANVFTFESLGYEEYTGHWFRSPGYRESYAVMGSGQAPEGQWIQLRADLHDAFRLERRIALHGNELHIRSVLKNRSLKTQLGALRMHARWRCDPMRDSVVYNLPGKGVNSEPMAAYVNREIENMPAGGITFDLPSLGINIAHAYAIDKIAKASLLSSGQGAQGAFIYDLYSYPCELKPNAAISINQVYRIYSRDKNDSKNNE